MPTRGTAQKKKRDDSAEPRKVTRVLDPREIQAKEEDRERKRQAKRDEGEDSDSEESWEDVSDDDDNNVDERFDDMEEEIIDEGSDDEAYEDLQDEVNEALKRVKFNEMGNEEVAADEDDDQEPEESRVWRADKGDALEAGQELAYSNKAYDSFFQLRTEYPCLSFDIIKDDLGAGRTGYPMTMFMVCGTQAQENNQNELVVLKVSNICRTKHDVESDDSDDEFIGDDKSSDDDDDENEETNGGEPIVAARTITHFGTANRVRCSHHKTTLTAVWSDAGHVQVFDIEDDFRAQADFSNWSKEQARNFGNNKDEKGKKPSALRFCTNSSTHKTEGYGLDWSTVAENTFASGDCNGDIYVWKPAQTRWAPIASSVNSKLPSVEEIRWSPQQEDVFMTCRAGGTVQVWDARDMRTSKMQWQADPTDINVADWNKSRPASHLFVTGAESGNVAVWDLRRIAQQDYSPIQELGFHRGKPITSVEFSAHNESVLAVTCDDGQCTLWDLSLERDADEEKQVVGELFDRNDISHLPDQLMFQHQGLRHPKEVHLHTQIPGMAVTTDFLGLHLFKPMNWRDLMK